MKRINIELIKTFYPHWGKFTAFNSFLHYFNPKQFKQSMKNVPMGDENVYLPPFLKNYCRKKIAKKKVQEYKLNDLKAEVML